MTRFRDGSRPYHLAFITGLACIKAVVTLSFKQLCTYLVSLLLVENYWQVTSKHM